MLISLLVMALAVSVEPFRIAMTVLMLNRPRPILQLLAFLCGGFTMGISVGLFVLFVFRRRLLGSTYFTLPTVQILIGVLALTVAAVLAARALMGKSTRRSDPGSGKVATRVRRLLNGPSLWIAAIAGLGIALPSVDYMAALAVILASGAAAMTQVGALLMFNAVAFALVEIPLLAYLLAPDATRTSMAALNDWIRSRRRVEVVTLLAVVGCVLSPSAWRACEGAYPKLLGLSLSGRRGRLATDRQEPSNRNTGSGKLSARTMGDADGGSARPRRGARLPVQCQQPESPRAGWKGPVQQ